MIRLYGCAEGPPSRKGVSHSEPRTVAHSRRLKSPPPQAAMNRTHSRRPPRPASRYLQPGPAGTASFQTRSRIGREGPHPSNAAIHRRREEPPNRGGARRNPDSERSGRRAGCHPPGYGRSWCSHGMAPRSPIPPMPGTPFLRTRAISVAIPGQGKPDPEKTAGTLGQGKPDPGKDRRDSRTGQTGSGKSRRDSRTRQTGSGEEPPGLPGKANRYRGRAPGHPGSHFRAPENGLIRKTRRSRRQTESSTTRPSVFLKTENSPRLRREGHIATGRASAPCRPSRRCRRQAHLRDIY